MSTFIGEENLLKNLGIKFPMGCNIIEFHYYSNSQTLELSIIPTIRVDKIIKLRFDDMKNLLLPKILSKNVPCPLLKIIDYKNSQLENINWRVGDFKTDTISFFL